MQNYYIFFEHARNIHFFLLLFVYVRNYLYLCTRKVQSVLKRMDLTACNLLKTMLKLVPQDQTVACGYFFTKL